MSLATIESASANGSGVLLRAQRNVMMTMQESVRATIVQDEIEVLHQTGELILGTIGITHFDLAITTTKCQSSGPPPDNRNQEDREAAARNPGSNLFVTGIHPRLSESEVSRLFEKYGDVEGCSIMKDPHTQESRGFGFVKMVTAEQADAAKEGLQGENIEGRTLSIEKARRARPRTPTPGKYFGPPKRGKLLIRCVLLISNIVSQTTNIVAHTVEDASTVSMSAVEVAMVVATMIITAVILAMMTVNVGRMDVETITAHVALTVMRPLAVKIAIAAVGTIAVEAMNTMVETADVRVMLVRMLIRCHPGSTGNHTVEVEPLTTVPTIGIPVDEPGQLNLPRCRALSQIRRPALSAACELVRLHLGHESDYYQLIPFLMLMCCSNRFCHHFFFIVFAEREDRSC